MIKILEDLQFITKVKNILLKICESSPEKKDRGIFRLHTDRVFSMKGYGTVVTGTVNSGNLKVGDKVEILPGQIMGRVRGLQSHGRDVKSVGLGDRAAINLQGVEKTDLERGSQLGTPGYFQSVMKIGVKLHLLSSAAKSITQNQRIRIHLGTQEVMARVSEIGKQFKLPIANVFHAGDGNLHPCILFDERQPGDVERVVEAGARILEICVEAGGAHNSFGGCKKSGSGERKLEGHRLGTVPRTL